MLEALRVWLINCKKMKLKLSHRDVLRYFSAVLSISTTRAHATTFSVLCFKMLNDLANG